MDFFRPGSGANLLIVPSAGSHYDDLYLMVLGTSAAYSALKLLPERSLKSASGYRLSGFHVTGISLSVYSPDIND